MLFEQGGVFIHTSQGEAEDVLLGGKLQVIRKVSDETVVIQQFFSSLLYIDHACRHVTSKWVELLTDLLLNVMHLLSGKVDKQHT